MPSVNELPSPVDFLVSPPPARIHAGDHNPARAIQPAAKRATSATLKNAADLLKAFNTWSYKREQPEDIEGMTGRLQAAVDANAPLSFVLYWGKGPRTTLAQPDIQCLDYLISMRARIESVYAPGVQFTLILTDTHANLNGHAEEAIQHYFGEIARAAEARGFQTRFLSDIVSQCGNEADAISNPPLELLDHLASCAKKWYRGPDDTVAGALTYYRMNMVEKGAVERYFPQAVFVTFNGSDVRDLFPSNMPIFYMYSLKRGTAEKPWFLPRIAHLASAEHA